MEVVGGSVVSADREGRDLWDRGFGGSSGCYDG